MQFEHAYDGWKQKRLTQEDAASLLNVCPRTFRRYICRYGLDVQEHEHHENIAAHPENCSLRFQDMTAMDGGSAEELFGTTPVRPSMDIKVSRK